MATEQDIKVTLDEFIVYSREQTKILQEVLKEIKEDNSSSDNRGQSIEQERERNRLLGEHSLLLKKISKQLGASSKVSRINDLPEEGGTGLLGFLKLAGLGAAGGIGLSTLMNLKPGDITVAINGIGEAIGNLGNISETINNKILGLKETFNDLSNVINPFINTISTAKEKVKDVVENGYGEAAQGALKASSQIVKAPTAEETLRAQQKHREQVRQAEAETKQLKEERKKVSNEAKKKAKAAEKELRKHQDRLALGASTQQDVDTAKANYTQAQAEYDRARTASPDEIASREKLNQLQQNAPKAPGRVETAIRNTAGKALNFGGNVLGIYAAKEVYDEEYKRQKTLGLSDTDATVIASAAAIGNFGGGNVGKIGGFTGGTLTTGVGGLAAGAAIGEAASNYGQSWFAAAAEAAVTDKAFSEALDTRTGEANVRLQQTGEGILNWFGSESNPLRNIGGSIGTGLYDLLHPEEASIGDPQTSTVIDKDRLSQDLAWNNARNYAQAATDPNIFNPIVEQANLEKKIKDTKAAIEQLKNVPSNSFYPKEQRDAATKRLNTLNTELTSLEQKSNLVQVDVQQISGNTSSTVSNKPVKTEDPVVAISIDEQTKEVKETNKILDKMSKMFEDFLAALSSMSTSIGSGEIGNLLGLTSDYSKPTSSGYTSGVANIQTTAETEQMMKDVYKAYREAGFSDAQATAVVAEVGREGSFLKRNIYGTHIDPKNKTVNLGMFSWQGKRGKALYEQLESKGLIQNDKMVEGYESLLTQAKFARHEMETTEAKSGGKAFLEKQNISQQEAALLLGKGVIRWAYDNPKYESGHLNRNFYYKRMQELKGQQPSTEQSSTVVPKSDVPIANPYSIQNYREELGSNIRQSSPFGERRGNRIHKGIDLAGPLGTPIKMPSILQKGVVRKVAYDEGGYGNYVVVDHPDGASSVYAHLSSVDVKSGQDITSGTTIGKMGSTGRSTGSHLHFEIRDKVGNKLDPNKALSNKKSTAITEDKSSESSFQNVLKAFDVTGTKIPLTPKEAMIQTGITPSQANKWLKVNNATDELLKAQTAKANQPMAVNVNNISSLGNQTEQQTVPIEYPTRNMDAKYLTYLNSIIFA